MFNLFKSKSNYEPLDYELRKYYEECLLWLIQEFPEPKIEDRKLLLPNQESFPLEWNGSKENVFDALSIICNNMQINPDTIQITFFYNGITEVNSGSSPIFIGNKPDIPKASGFYKNDKIDGNYQIYIDEELIHEPDYLISTLAHELAHVKLLGEKNLEENDEYLTDFSTVFFGLGIFNANTAFSFSTEFDRWSYRIAGYLSIDEWAYALALYSFVRHDDNPDWEKYLSSTLRSEFKKCLQYLIKSESEIFIRSKK